MHVFFLKKKQKEKFIGSMGRREAEDEDYRNEKNEEKLTWTMASMCVRCVGVCYLRYYGFCFFVFVFFSFFLFLRGI